MWVGVALGLLLAIWAAMAVCIYYGIGLSLPASNGSDSTLSRFGQLWTNLPDELKRVGGLVCGAAMAGGLALAVIFSRMTGYIFYSVLGVTLLLCGIQLSRRQLLAFFPARPPAQVALLLGLVLLGCWCSGESVRRPRSCPLRRQRPRNARRGVNMIAAVLAVAKQAHAHQAAQTGFDPIRQFPGQTDLLTWCREMGVGTAILLVLIGVVYLLYGWSIYRPLITLNAAILGGYIGVIAGQRMGDYELAGGLVGAIVAAAIAWPLIKWAVAVLGGVCGAIVGASIWKMCGQDPTFAWAGAMTGMVGFGMFSFILFRGSIIMYTSLQGGMMLVVGMLGLGYSYPALAKSLGTHLTTQPLALPLAVLVPTILGLIYQQTHSAGGGGAPASAGGGGGGGDKKK